MRSFLGVPPNMKFIRRKSSGAPMTMEMSEHGGKFTVLREEFTLQDFKDKWPDFRPHEFQSDDTGEILVAVQMLDRLQEARTEYDGPFMINSAFRTKELNDSVGSNEYSYHRKGLAVDISVIGLQPLKLSRLLKKHGFTGQGAYPDDNFLHADIGEYARWGDWSKWRATNKHKVKEPAEVKNKRNDKIVGGISGTALVGLVPSVVNSTLPVWFIAPAFIAILGLIGWYMWRRSK